MSGAVSAALRRRAAAVLAGGVSSDARRMGGAELFVERAAGAYLWDVDGARYIDYVLGQGPALLGHSAPVVAEAVARQARCGITYSAQHAQEVELAERLCAMIPSADLVRFNSVGSEATHAALRLARGHTGRTRMVKFEGHYHGWLDPVLYSVHPALDQAGPAQAPLTVPGTAGQQLSTSGDVIVLPWNDIEAVAAAFDRYGPDIAAVIAEPIACNAGVLMPDEGFLEKLQAICHDSGALLIFDEVITGFRLAPGGAQEYLGVTPDLAVFGKAIAGGMQVSALVGRAEVMEDISSGKVAHAGTFNSHPVAVAAAAAVTRVLDEQRDEVYPELFRLGRRLMAGLRGAAAQAGLDLLVTGPGPVFQTYLTDRRSIRNYRDFASTDRPRMAALHRELAIRGVNMVPRGLWFMSTAHTDADIDETIGAAQSAFTALPR